MTGEDDGADTSDEEYGITDEDMELIEAFCAKRRYERSVYDLQKDSNR